MPISSEVVSWVSLLPSFRWSKPVKVDPLGQLKEPESLLVPNLFLVKIVVTNFPTHLAP
jgi:hypothetical protein